MTERLGYKPGNNGNIRKHEFFAKINWRQLEARRIEAPFKPKIVSNLNIYQLCDIEFCKLFCVYLGLLHPTLVQYYETCRDDSKVYVQLHSWSDFDRYLMKMSAHQLKHLRRHLPNNAARLTFF